MHFNSSIFIPVKSKIKTFHRSLFIECFLIILIIVLAAIFVNLKMLRYGVIFQASDMEIHFQQKFLSLPQNTCSLMSLVL